MNCQRVKENFSLYYDEVISSADRGRIEKHLTSCSSCQQEYLLWRENISLIKEMPDYPVPSYLWLKIKDKIQADQSKNLTFSFLFLRRWAWVSIFIILIISYGLFINYKNNQRKDMNIQLANFLIYDLVVSPEGTTIVQNFITVYDVLLEEDNYLIDYLEEDTNKSLLEFLGKGGEIDEGS